VTFVASAYVGPFIEITSEFHVGQEVFILGLSLYAIAFAITPLFWAPFSEMFGRRPLFIITYGGFAAFNGGAVASQNIWTLLILRFFAGAFAASSLASAGGVIADLFVALKRSIPLSIFCLTTFFGIVIGPSIGAFIGENVGWRWVEGVMAIFTGVIWVVICVFLPETYSPVLLHRRAKTLTQMTGLVYRSKFEEKGMKTVGQLFKVSLIRPWILLFREPIVLLLSIYMSIIFGTLHMFFDAFPIVYQEQRHWTEGIGGLAFLGVLVGVFIGFIYTTLDDLRYKRIAKQHQGHAPPEARLPPAMVGAICLPISLFWFAWTNYPSIHWSVSIIASSPFGFGMFTIFLAVLNYLIDAYTIYAASVLAANLVLRYIFAAAFPLFTKQMYDSLGIHWATCVPAFLTLICVPFPFLFYKYGARIRKKCKYSAEAQEAH
jgi:MFS family permease